MGVQGLSTFFELNPQLTDYYKLHDTPVVIDGNNLMHVLHFSYNVDCVYGGDYNKYAKVIKSYFSAFIDCNIKPIIVFDGGYDKCDRKLETVMRRSRARLTRAQHIAKYGKCSGNILPIIAPEVFKGVLEEMNIVYVQCEFEADEQLTVLANHYQCSVISNDSDFFIYDLHKGFILLDSVKATVCCSEDKGIQYNYLECSVYHIDKFLSHFPGIDKSVLPLFGALIGNDYVDASVFENFFSNIQLPKCESCKLKVGTNQKRIIELLTWLKHVNLNEGIKQVLEQLKQEKRAYVKSVIDHAVDGYKMQKTNLIFIIDGKLSELKCEIALNTKLKFPCNFALPTHFILQFQTGNFPSFFLNVITLHRIFLPSQVENVSLDSSFVCSRFIRKVLYGILLRHDSSDSECNSSLCLRGIEEYDRKSGNLSQDIVNPIFSINGIGSLPKLNELDSLEVEKSKEIILNVLGIERDFLLFIPEVWQLLFGCINYWLKNSSPLPSTESIYALVINIIYFSFISSSQFDNVNFYELCTSSKECDSSTISSAVSNIKESQIEFTKKNLKKYVKKPEFNKAKPLMVNIIHSFSQLQSCLLYSRYLNKLLNSPYKCPSVHMTFNGTMLYNLTNEISTRPFPELFVSEILGRESPFDTLFQVIKNKMIENLATKSIKRFRPSEIRQRRKKTKKFKNSISSSLTI